MKTTLSIALVLCLVALVASGTMLEPAAPSPAGALLDGGDVVALRSLTLKKGADAKAFEKYYAQVVTPAYDQYVPGVSSFVMRAERGNHKGSYVHVFVFDSADTRDFYFPKEGEGPSEDGGKLWSQLPEFDFEPYLEPADTTTVNYTDYIVIE